MSKSGNHKYEKYVGDYLSDQRALRRSDIRMMESQLDHIVKGTPAADVKVPEVSSPSPLSKPQADGSLSPPSVETRPSTPDPLSTLPSSPPQIYLNLLILESSLRAQYLALRDRRRQNTFFLTLLALWIAYFSYALFLRPREDGRGVGGSVYWMVEMGEKVALLGGIVTAILVWGTGQWERGMRWPRRWFTVANRGLRGMNTKIVIIRGPWWRELLSYLSFLFPIPAFFGSTSNYQYVEVHPSERRAHRPYHVVDDNDYESGVIEEDLSPGGDHIRLLLLPKAFSPEFRESWDEYRAEFWEKENERRAQLRRKIREREKQLARQEGGWLWWFYLPRARQRRLKLLEQARHHHSQHAAGKSLDARTRRHTRSASQSQGSRGVSRSATPESGSATDSQPRRKKGTKSSARASSPLTVMSEEPGRRSRHGTPEGAAAEA
ncbi:hypothetical protein VTN31DRAFT_2009 [Thermomyces dupontii]|uniref:uncharacterized protein n=1 Tax=Talaromyces thermophilus TaxID=28565 RepID=UPI00374407F3